MCYRKEIYMNIHIENLKCQQISPTVIGRGFFFILCHTIIINKIILPSTLMYMSRLFIKKIN